MNYMGLLASQPTLGPYPGNVERCIALFAKRYAEGKQYFNFINEDDLPDCACENAVKRAALARGRGA